MNKKEAIDIFFSINNLFKIIYKWKMYDTID